MNSKVIKYIFLLSCLVNISFIFFISSFSKTFSLDDIENRISSNVYNIGNDYIENISSYTSINLYKKYFDYNNCYIEVINNDKKQEDDKYVVNGSKTILYDENGNIIDSYINIIKGDIDSNGIVDNKDLEKFGEYLVEDSSLTTYQEKSLDINNDNQLKLNDLLLLDKSITLGYQELSIEEDEIVIRLNATKRLNTNIIPNYGLNQNLKWISSDNDIVTVDDTGKIFANNGGEAIIQAITQDGEKKDSVKVVVDNSIILESYSGRGYVDGYDTKIHIDLINYEGINCSSEDESIASCSIDKEYLVIKAHKTGITNITVKGEKYKDAIYRVDCGVPGISSYYKAGCNMTYTPVVGFFAGELEDFILESSDPEIVIGSSVGTLTTGAKALVIKYGKKYGRTTVKIKGSTTDEVLGEMLIDHSIMTLEERYRFVDLDEDFSININGENLGNITCISNNEEVATCNIEDNKLLVNTNSIVGQADITVYNKFTYEGGWNGDCGSQPFTVFVGVE